MVFFLVKYIYSITLTAMTPQTYKPIFYNFCSTPQGTKTKNPEVDKEWKPKSATHLHQTILHNQDSKLIKKKKKEVAAAAAAVWEGKKEIGRWQSKSKTQLTFANAIETHMLYLIEKR